MTQLNIYQRLHAAMQDVSFVQKEEKKVNGQYTFVSHDAVTRVTREALMKHGVIYHPANMKASQDGNRTEVSLDLIFVNIDKPEDQIIVPSFGYGIDQQDKGPGKAMSYAVKYGLLKALALETGDDPEKDQIEHKPNGKKSIVADGNHRSGNKLIDKGVDEALKFIRDTVDLESAKKVGRHQWKLCKDNGAHPDQLEIIQQQVENHCQFLEAKGLQA